MEANWFIIVPVLVAIIAIIVLVLRRNKKDEKDLVETIIKEDEMPIRKEPDNEVYPPDEKG